MIIFSLISFLLRMLVEIKWLWIQGSSTLGTSEDQHLRYLDTNCWSFFFSLAMSCQENWSHQLTPVPALPTPGATGSSPRNWPRECCFNMQFWLILWTQTILKEKKKFFQLVFLWRMFLFCSLQIAVWQWELLKEDFCWSDQCFILWIQWLRDGRSQQPQPLTT